MRTARPAPQQPSGMPFAKYRPFLDVVSIDLPDRTWPDKRITAAPRWLSTDLRDGNQSLIEPMGPQAKRAIFDLLVSMGFKEIEIGFPAASQTDFDFVRSLVDDGAIPEDVTISVLTQSRGELIDRTLDACVGIPRATVHLYNALSPLFRNVVFRMDRDQIRELAVDGTRQIMARAEKVLDEDTIFGYEYSPEIFVDTELDYSLEVCQAVMDVWEPEEDREIILNLPSTVERATGMDVPPRTPYAGELVYTSFSGSHQDAIKKGFAARNTQVSAKKAEGLTDAEAEIAVPWAMPYLPIDPHDVGRSYEAVVRVNSQSGKGGVAYLLGTTRKLELPRRLQIEFSRIVQRHTDTYGGEVDGARLWSIFADEYLPAAAAPEAELSRWGRFELRGATLTSTGDDEDSTLTVTLVDGGEEKHLTASGNGPLDAFVTALESTGLSVRILDYVEHALSEGRDAKAASYVECEVDGQVLWGVGIDPSITTSSFKAVISALNRALR